MAQFASGNVVPLGDHPRARSKLTPRESADMLTDCRELALARMSVALSGMLDRVEEDLFELAEKAIDRDAQNTYLDARAQAREKRPVIESSFRSHFVEFFNRKVRGRDESVSASAPAELTLVGNEDLEERIAVRDMSRKLGAACEGELYALSQRMGFLLERPELDDEANPLSPATVCEALKDACDQVGSDFKVRRALLRQLEYHAEAELQRVYHDLNAHLVERRILPEVRAVGVRRAGATGQRASSSAQGAAKPATAAPAPSSATPQDIFGTLAQLLGAALPGAGASNPAGFAAGNSTAFAHAVTSQGLPGAMASAAGAGSSASDFAASGVPAAPASFLSELTRMHREAAVATAGAEGNVNIVKGIRAAPQSASLATVDAMTIDIVAMLFDYIFEDRHIPAEAKAWLGRLQIPTLKAALLDKNFFSSKAHPARRLIDRLAECAIGLDGGNADGSGCSALVEGVVGRILSDFDTDVAVFERELSRVESFIEERKKAEADIVERSARLMEERERTEIARAQAEVEVERRLEENRWVPPVVRAMLEDAWVRALGAARCEEGEESPAWQSMLQTMDDLVWSVEPKVQAEDRKRLVALLPSMLKKVVEGLRRGGMQDDGRDAFLGALVDCHAAAVKTGLRGHLVAPAAAPVPALPTQPEIARELVPAGDIRVEEIRLRTGGGRSVRNVFTRTGIWTNLQRGTWVEFLAAAGHTRARLTWISPNKGVYLFTNPLSAAAAVSISPEALAEQMRLGDARMLDDAPLTGRAVDSLLANLRHAASDAPQG